MNLSALIPQQYQTYVKWGLFTAFLVYLYKKGRLVSPDMSGRADAYRLNVNLNPMINRLGRRYKLDLETRQAIKDIATHTIGRVMNRKLAP